MEFAAGRVSADRGSVFECISHQTKLKVSAHRISQCTAHAEGGADAYTLKPLNVITPPTTHKKMLTPTLPVALKIPEGVEKTA